MIFRNFCCREKFGPTVTLHFKWDQSYSLTLIMIFRLTPVSCLMTVRQSELVKSEEISTSPPDPSVTPGRGVPSGGASEVVTVSVAGAMETASTDVTVSNCWSEPNGTLNTTSQPLTLRDLIEEVVAFKLFRVKFYILLMDAAKSDSRTVSWDLRIWHKVIFLLNNWT